MRYDQLKHSQKAIAILLLACRTVCGQPVPAEGDMPSAPPLRLALLQDDAGVLIEEDVIIVRDVVYKTTETDAGEPIDLTMDVAFPREASADRLPVIVYIHGGGWRNGSKASGEPYLRVNVEAGYFAASIDYRLTEQAKYPAAVNDCKQAIRFLRASAEELHIDPNRICVCGHSAGGHLAVLLATSGDSGAFPPDDEASGASDAVSCAVSISGPMDLLDESFGETPPNWIKEWIGSADRDEFESHARTASPITHLDSGDPPIMIVHGTNDRLVPFEQASIFAHAMIDAGVECEFVPVKGAGHAVVDPSVYLRTAAFIDSHLAGDLTGVLRRTEKDDLAPERRGLSDRNRPAEGD